ALVVGEGVVDARDALAGDFHDEGRFLRAHMLTRNLPRSLFHLRIAATRSAGLTWEECANIFIYYINS
ncbi:MAG: hypothetical protein ACRETW_08825, partial [Stenotrophobium sp.]